VIHFRADNASREEFLISEQSWLDVWSFTCGFCVGMLEQEMLNLNLNEMNARLATRMGIRLTGWLGIEEKDRNFTTYFIEELARFANFMLHSGGFHREQTMA